MQPHDVSVLTILRPQMLRLLVVRSIVGFIQLRLNRELKLAASL